MTTDVELDHLAREVRRIAVKGDPTARDVRTIADALGVTLERLAATRRELAETRRLVDVVAPPTAFDIGARVFKEVTNLKHGPGGTGARGPCDPDCAKCAAEGSTPSATLRCDDCGNNRWLVIGSRLCTKCQERDRLRAALRRALELATATEGRADDIAATNAEVAELRKVLDGA